MNEPQDETPAQKEAKAKAQERAQEEAQINSYIKSRARNVPANDLDLQMQVTDPAWQNLSPDLQEKLLKQIGEETEGGKKLYETLHGILALYTRDIRLGNLSTWNNEYEYVCYCIESSVIFLSRGYPEPCLAFLNLALARLEPSSSKSGFLRKLMNTIRTERFSSQTEPEKKSPLGGYKKGGF